MAMFGMYVVIFYMFISIFAPVLPIYSFKHQIIDHQYLPPSLTKNAGQLYFERSERLMNALAAKQNRELNQEEIAELDAIKHQIATETAVIDGKEVKIHERRYIFGTDYLGRDMLARVVYGGQISIAIGFIGTITSVFIGIVLGAIAGYVGGKVDYIIMRIVDIIYGLPYMMLVIIFMAIFGKNILNLFFCSCYCKLAYCSPCSTRPDYVS